MTKTHEQVPSNDDCPLTPVPQMQCCAACGLGLTLFLVTNSSLIAPAVASPLLPDSPSRIWGRSDRPPVPPPRSLVG
jgi:hypothetical protein